MNQCQNRYNCGNQEREFWIVFAIELFLSVLSGWVLSPLLQGLCQSLFGVKEAHKKPTNETTKVTEQTKNMRSMNSSKSSPSIN